MGDGSGTTATMPLVIVPLRYVILSTRLLVSTSRSLSVLKHFMKGCDGQESNILTTNKPDATIKTVELIDASRTTERLMADTG